MELKHLDQLTPVETIADDDAVVGIFNSDINIAKVEDIAAAAGNILIDRNKVATPESVAQAIVNAEDARQYGVCINHATGSPTLERIGAAVGLKAEVATGDSTPVNDFDYIYPKLKIPFNEETNNELFVFSNGRIRLCACNWSICILQVFGD